MQAAEQGTDRDTPDTTASTTERASPSSPPFASYDFSVASASPRGREPEREDELRSRTTSHLPPPRTPLSTRSRIRDTSSDYYTAVWGSPYERSVSPSGTARTALSEQLPSELETSPIPTFGLEHLVPSRLGDLSLLRPDLSLLDQPIVEEDDDSHTPRSRTKRWVQLPQRQESERSRWWSDESRSESQEVHQRHRASSPSPASVLGAEKPSAKGHKKREDNRTLNQQSFLEILKDDNASDMSSLYASRWADTPPPDEDEAFKASFAKPADEKPLPELPKEAAEETTANVEEDVKEARSDAAEERREETLEPTPEVREPLPEQPELKSNASPAPPAMHPNRLEPPRLRKKLSWRGKNCIVSIPDVDFEALGLPMPMTGEEVEQRLKQFEDAGLNTQGFDLSSDQLSDELGHARPIYPDEDESRQVSTQQPPKVVLPDLNRWKKMQDDLIEAKLAALGVGSVPDEQPAPSPQHVSRQSSVQYPPMSFSPPPFSPPIPTGSAGSMGRPPMMRGHSHTMSVASPISPGAGPFGHMHRHSTFAGPFGFPQLQTQQLPQQGPQSPMAAMQAFSPQVAALRQDLGAARGSGSPLSQQMLPQTPQDYSRGMVDDQRRRQHGYSQSIQPMPLPPQNSFMPQLPGFHQQTPALPELPEEDDEEELRNPEEDSGPEPPAYVPPHKRAQYNADIAVPSPTRGHRHNPSEGLEREAMEAEQRREEEERDSRSIANDHVQQSMANFTAGKDSMDERPSATATEHALETSAPRFNVAAPSFNFNPKASFEPVSTTFNFNAQPPKAAPATSNGHTRQASSGGSLSVTAPAFKPANPLSVPQSDFSFSASGPEFKSNAIDPPKPKQDERTVVDELPSIFGKVDVPEIVKPARRSKAIAIVRPDEVKESSEEADDDGRIGRGDDRLKRQQQRKFDDDGDQVPQFAEPTPTPWADKRRNRQSVRLSTPSTVDQFELEASRALDEVAFKDADSAEPPVEETEPESSGAKRSFHGHNKSSSLSASAKPFEPAPSHFDAPKDGDRPAAHDRIASISELEEGEIREDETEVSPMRSRKQSGLPSEEVTFDYPADGRISKVAHADPSFDEIDAVMRQLNDADVEAKPMQTEERQTSPMPPPDDQAFAGVTYLPGWPRSDAPSPSPARRQLPVEPPSPVYERTDSRERAANGWPQARRLNRAEDVPVSDWSDMLSSPDEVKLHARSNFFDDRIEQVLGRVVDRRMVPLEESLRNMQAAAAAKKRGKAEEESSLKRASSTAESDADDEDDLSDAPRQRPISRGRDKRFDDIKTAVMEALREQSPKRSQYDITDLHSALADMKVSFARAASASLELEDVRAVVEEVMSRQSSQAVAPAQGEERKGTHQREMSELEGRLNETLAGALEEANHRRSVEEREAETKRMLRLAEEELQILRDSSRDDDGRLSAMEEERRELLERAERAEEAHNRADDRIKELEAETEAMQGTLEEYRLSATKWRQRSDEAHQEREGLEETIAGLERQLEEGQESSSSMRRRLEKLHHDMATAAGQLTSEKASWRAREEDYRLRCEALEAENAAHARKRHEMEEELRNARASMMEASEARRALDQTRASNLSLDELVRRLQAELSEKHALAARYERDFNDAREAGRMEVHRTRMSLETEVEAANHQVNILRAEFESELMRTRAELDNMRMEAETAKARHEQLLEDEDAARRDALRKVNQANSIALEEARQKHETTLKDLTAQHARSMQYAMEDKQRSEYILNERLSLYEDKLQHSNDRILHLEERLEVAKSAAQAAVMSVQKGPAPAAATSSRIPEKVSPQALRESILVLQEQLQERESRIEKLQNEVDKEGPAKLKQRDSEIAWLRELLGVRNEDLTELVNTLARPTFDRDAVRDTAIRIRANLQMEEQEKERFGYGGQSVGGQALASLSSFATPKAASLTSAFNKWRSTMESSALKNAPRSAPPARSATPSKAQRPQAPSALPSGYTAGLMTPPASNLRNSPGAEVTKSLPPPRLQNRAPSYEPPIEAALGAQDGGQTDDHPDTRPDPEPAVQPARPTSSHRASDSLEDPTTPLFGEQQYDNDAQDSGSQVQTMEDDDLDITDNEAPAFRSLEDELEPTSHLEMAS